MQTYPTREGKQQRQRFCAICPTTPTGSYKSACPADFPFVARQSMKKVRNDEKISFGRGGFGTLRALG